MKLIKLSTSAITRNLKTAFNVSTETISLLYPKLTSNFFCTSSFDDCPKYESEDSSKISITSSSQRVAHSYSLRSKPIQKIFSSSTRATSSSISSLLHQHAQLFSSTSEKLPPFLPDILLSHSPSSGIETSFTVNSYSASTHLIGGDQGLVSTVSTINIAEFPF